MKVLMVNNNHFLKGGATRAYFDTIKILEDKGHHVAHFSTAAKENIPSPWEKYFVQGHDLADSSSHSHLQKIKIVFRIWYNFETRRKLRELLAEFQPDVAHLHNIYHHLSPSVIDELKKQDIPVVMTLHDFKIVCPNYDLYAHGDVYDRCKNGKYYQCVLDRCVKNSYLKSFVCMAEAYLHQLLGIYEKVDVFTAPSKFYVKKAKEFGFKREIEFLPNVIFTESDQGQSGNEARGEKFFLFDGQLNEEKGIDDLLRAYAKIEVEEKLYVLGDGPLEGDLKKMAQELGIANKVRFMPFIKTTVEEKKAMHAGSTAVVSPSRCYENAPYSVLQAMGSGSLVVCHDQGGARELSANGKRGLVYRKNDINDLARAMKQATEDPEKREKVIAKGKNFVRENYSEKIFYSTLIKIYNQARREAGERSGL